MTGEAPDTNLPAAVYRAFIEALNRQDLDTEPAGMLLVQLAYMQGLGPRIGLSLARETTSAAQSGTFGP